MNAKRIVIADYAKMVNGKDVYIEYAEYDESDGRWYFFSDEDCYTMNNFDEETTKKFQSKISIMDAQDVLNAMERYGLTLRRLTGEDDFGKKRREGWVVKITRNNYGSMIQFNLSSTCDRFNDCFGATPQEAVQKAIDRINEAAKKDSH